MAEPTSSDADQTAARLLAPRPSRGPGMTAVTENGKVVSWPVNLIATVVGFFALLAAPWVCQSIVLAIEEDAIVDDPFASLFIMASFEDAGIVASIGSMAYLVIGVALQAWQYHRPFSSYRPIQLAFPAALFLIVPEALLRGGSVVSGVTAAVVLAVTFVIYWTIVVVLREELD